LDAIGDFECTLDEILGVERPSVEDVLSEFMSPAKANPAMQDSSPASREIHTNVENDM
jgi:hypothetical protein